MSRIKTYQRIAAIQRLQQTLAEAELLAARDGVAQVEHDLAACVRDNVVARENSVRALTVGDADGWVASQRTTEVVAWRSELLGRELVRRREAEAEKFATYSGARLRCEQTGILIGTERKMERAAEDLRSQKIADEFALRKFS